MPQIVNEVRLKRKREWTRKGVAKWRKQHPEEAKAQQKRYYEGHIKQIVARVKEWKKKHPDKVKISQRKSDIKRHFGSVETYETALNKCGGFCGCGCGREANCVHHNDGRSIWNSPSELVDNKQSNLKPMNDRCHMRFHALKAVKIVYKILRGGKT